MIYVNKKVVATKSLAQQTGQIIANIKALEEKNLVRIVDFTIYLHVSLWTDKKVALNWIECLYIYYKVKRGFKIGTLYFKNIQTEEIIGTWINKKPKVLIF
jgi:hypothetical protein